MRPAIPLFALALFAPMAASAQQPLPDFLDAASDAALDVREAEAALHTAQSQVDEARARLLPSVSGSFGYQRNEPEVGFTQCADPMTMTMCVQRTIVAGDAASASGTLSVPILDLSAWAGFIQSEAAADATGAQLEVAQQNVSVAVVQIWHQVVAQRALVAVAEHNLETADRNRTAAAARVEVGVSPQLELSRADAELARARQSLAAAQLQATLAARNLENLTGLEPSDAAVALDDDLAAERPLAIYLEAVTDLPSVRAAHAQQRTAGIARDAAWLALAPTISGTAVVRWANAAGFAGRQDSEYVGVTATWILDFARPARIGTAQAQLEAAGVRAERALQVAETSIFEAWQRVETARASLEAADAALDASRRAAEDARARYESGAGTQLDQITAERDLFQAEGARIQALADLRVARAVLRLRSGMEP
jgi:outer membrane protein